MKTNMDTNTLKNIADTISNKYENIFILFANNKDGNLNLIARSNSKIEAGKIVKTYSSKIGGNGGGSNKFAMGSFKDLKNLDKTLLELENEIWTN